METGLHAPSGAGGTSGMSCERRSRAPATGVRNWNPNRYVNNCFSLFKGLESRFVCSSVPPGAG
jgi:hypothetical protein